MTATAMRHGLLTCEVCELLNRHTHTGEENCARCGAVLRARKRDSITRTWALLVAAAILYVPANILPVMRTAQAPNTQVDDTILSGVIHLWNTGSWGLAIIVFLASIVIPLAKLVSLGYLAWMAQRRSTWNPEQRARLYRATHYIGRWSMVDIYVGATLVALVQLSPFASVDPGPAAIAFSAVVILTMLASQSFDPRLTWDPLDDTPWPTRRIP
jgi:paraquat-inducible protein A